MEELIDLLNTIRPLSASLEDHLRTIISCYEFSKNRLLLNKGETANHILFIEKGLVRSFAIINHTDTTRWFMEEGNIIISVISFFKRLAATASIEALEDCICWGITHDQLYKTYDLFPEFNWHRAVITENYYCISEMRHESRQMLTPIEKYELIMAQQPGLVNRVPGKYMASYLDVSLRTYAQMRADYREKYGLPG